MGNADSTSQLHGYVDTVRTEHPFPDGGGGDCESVPREAQCACYVQEYLEAMVPWFHDCKPPAEWVTFCKVMEALRGVVRDYGCPKEVHEQFERLVLEVRAAMQQQVRPPPSAAPSTAGLVLVHRQGDEDVGNFLLETAKDVPPCVGHPLGHRTLEMQAYTMHDAVHELLIQLGRDPDHGPAYELYPSGGPTGFMVFPTNEHDMEIECPGGRKSEGFLPWGGSKLSCARLASQSAKTEVFVHRNTEGETVGDYLVDRTQSPPTTTKSTFDRLQERLLRGDGRERAERVAVVGPVDVLFDHNFEPVEDVPDNADGTTGALWVVSVPAPNFATSDSPHRKQFVEEIPGVHSLVPPEKEEAVRQQFRALWGRILDRMEDRRVTHACLCAIGCGAFRGRDDKAVKNLPGLYAEALRDVLHGRRQGRTDLYLRAVILALPVFGTQETDDTWRAFAQVFRATTTPLDVAVLLSPVHGIVELADQLRRSLLGVTVGLLNPSDPLAVRAGYLGMHWEGGRGTYALEELLALRTTLLMGHAGLNPGPWTGPGHPGATIVPDKQVGLNSLDMQLD